MAPICGGVSEAKEPDETVISIFESVSLNDCLDLTGFHISFHHFSLQIRPELESKLGGGSLSAAKPVSYKSQLVNGVNYFIKV